MAATAPIPTPSNIVSNGAFTSNSLPQETYNTIKTIFLRPEFQDFVSTYMSHVFVPEEQSPPTPQLVDTQEPHFFGAMDELTLEEPAKDLFNGTTLELTSCFCETKSKIESHNSNFPTYEELFQYEDPTVFPMTVSNDNIKWSFQQKDVPLHRSLPEMPLTSSDLSLEVDSRSPSPTCLLSDSPLLSPQRTPSPPPRHSVSFISRSMSIPKFERANSPNYYFSAPSSATNSPTKPQKAPTPYSTLPNTDIRLERTPQRKVIWTPLLHERFLSALETLDPSGEGIGTWFSFSL